MAHDMCHWLDQYRKTTVCDVINELSDRGLLTKKGEKVCKALELLTGVRATNKGVPEKIIKFYKRFDNWADKNDIEI